MRPSIVANAAVAALFGASAQALGGGLAIGTQSGSGTGNAFAAGAAAAEDASTVWYNPAGMTLLPGRSAVAIAAHALKPSFRFQDRASGLPPGTGEGGDGGDWAAVPQAFAATSIGERWRIGFAINVPYGLATDYDAGWRGQGIALLSELRIFNFNLGAAYRLSEALSLGAGVSYQRTLLKFNSVPGAAAGIPGLAEVKLDDGSVGFNAGILLHPSAGARIGLHYRSAVDYDLAGTVAAPAVLGGSSAAAAGVKTPESFSLSAIAPLGPRWEIMGDVTWTAWSRLQALDVVRTSGAAAGTRFTRLGFGWKDTWRFSLGANYKASAAFKLRLGIAHDQTPANDLNRTPRVPDEDRLWLAIGGQYRLSRAGTLDVGYAHEVIKDAAVDNVPPLPRVNAPRLIGHFRNKADIVSVQYSHAF